MSEIQSTRRAAIAENSVLSNSKRGFPYKKVAIGVLIALVVIALILLVINMVINSYFAKVTVFDGEWEIDRDKLSQMPIYVNNKEYFSKTEDLHKAYDAVLLNYANSASDMKHDENVYTYAIYGVDQFGEASNANADIVMLASVNKDKEHVTYLAFETRMLVYIPSVGVGPLSDAYLLGGPLLMTDTISQNYGIQVDGFVSLNMSAFVDMIDTFGSISINGDNATVEKINADIVAFNEAKGLAGEDMAQPVKLEGGKIVLNGKQSLAYLRGAGDGKANAANTVLSQITSTIFEKGFGGMKSAMDMALEETTVYVVRDDVGALIEIGTSVFGSIEAMPVGNMEGREAIGPGFICNYEGERIAIVTELYGE
ncbi:MAG: LCP family protein [Clostridia bacterium]|nr:LCP family protein [Clostridia bacterium]